MKHRIFVSGAGGFLGSNLLNVIKGSGIEARAFERPRELSWRENPVEFGQSVAQQITEFEPTWVVNAANHFTRGFPEDEVIKTLEANVALPMLMAGAANSINAPFLHLGSYWQLPWYAEKPSNQSLYLYSKMLASKILASSAKHGAVVTEVLITDTFGHGDTRDKLIPQALDAKRAGKTFEVSSSQAVVNLTSAQGISESLQNTLLNSSAKKPGSVTVVQPSLQIQVGRLLDLLEVKWIEKGAPALTPQEIVSFQEISNGFDSLEVESVEVALDRLMQLK